MKKIIAVLTVMLLLCSVSVVASAAPAALDGFEVTMLVESLQFINDAGFYPTTSGDQPFLVPSPDTARPITLEDGKLTFLQQECWGALLSMNPDLQELSLNKTGWGFSIENGDVDTTLCVSFNEAATNQTYVIDENSVYMLVSEDGEIIVDYAVWTSSNQGGAIIPADFKGHIYIPFDQYYNSLDYSAYDPSTMKLFTPIYALSGGAEFTFCEYFVYESDKNLEDMTDDNPTEPAETPTNEPVQTPTTEVTEPVQTPTTEVTEPDVTEPDVTEPDVTEPEETEEVTDPAETEEVIAPTETEEVTDPAETEAPSEQATQESGNDNAGEFPWIIVAIAAVVVIAGAVVAVILVKKNKKAE